ncbi:uncharacterized protein BT62DRAFT_188570 [Guyanagaster necrorhizus]|uniref:Uncharacterized protein n=1 Tax=Guyanagaster necrorhizus TaxID=856835 RepID=A0A9P7VSM5_9AGAR|nr:uncharacterized protein BT62DRAFT_188570 [Guyanagaster necrorhizus MCA 3950]KAG7445289.1 hypothetical protein BT62DRAFT_188570 [Guyanagaster necrorhizus MCA 3950]
MPEIPLEAIRDAKVPIASSLKKSDNSSWISFLDDVVEDAEKDILYAPIEEEEPDIRDDRPQKSHRYASRWDGFHANQSEDNTPRPVLDKAWRGLNRPVPLPKKAWSAEEQRYIRHPKRQGELEEKKPQPPPPPPPTPTPSQDGMSALERAKAIVDSRKRTMIVPPPRPRRK